MTVTLPTFLIIGAAKSGTTSLARYLGAHPDVFIPPAKEMRFFSEESNWDKGLDWYGSQFDDAGRCSAIGEASPAYSAYPTHMRVPEKISRTIPEVRLIYLVREPIARIMSHYRYAVDRGKEWRSADEAVTRRADYLHRSQYAMQLGRYLRFFPRDSILVIRSEDLLEQRAGTLRSVFEFIGVDPDWEGEEFDKVFNTREQLERGGYRGRVARQVERNRDLGETSWTSIAGKLHREFRVRARSRSLLDSKLSDWADDFLRAQLRPDIRRLRSIIPGGFDGWGIA